MTTHTNTTVTPEQRFTANALIKSLREQDRKTDAMIVDRACMWESFPQHYSDEKVHLAKLLIQCDFDSEQWHLIASAILIVIESK